MADAAAMFRELINLREKATREEEKVLNNARLEEYEKWRNVIQEKESAIADKDAEIAALRARLGE